MGRTRAFGIILFDDSECAAITNPAGILAGTAIGAAVGAILEEGQILFLASLSSV